jgi:hypothetical protein
MATSAKQIQITEQTSRAVVENQLRVGLDVVCYQRGTFLYYFFLKLVERGEERLLKKNIPPRERVSLSFSLSLSLARAFLVVHLLVLLFSSARDDCFVFRTLARARAR